MMNNPVSSLIENAEIKFHIFNESKDLTYLLLFLPYKRFEMLDDNYLYIDSYFIASNILYKEAKNLTEKLKAKLDAEIKAYKGFLKALYIKSGIAFPLKSTLVAIPPFGSYVALSAIEIHAGLPKDDNDFINTFDFNQGYINICENCNICIKACKQNAISDVFSKEKCLRSYQGSIKPSEYDLSQLNNSILGCDVCAKVCPVNKSLDTISVNESLKAILKKTEFIKALDMPKSQFPLTTLIGNNYAKPIKLLYFTINTMRNKEYLPLLYNYLNHNDEHIKRITQEVIDDIIRKTSL